MAWLLDCLWSAAAFFMLGADRDPTSVCRDTLCDVANDRLESQSLTYAYLPQRRRDEVCRRELGAAAPVIHRRVGSERRAARPMSSDATEAAWVDRRDFNTHEQIACRRRD